MTENTEITIDPDISIAELQGKYPQVIDFLIAEYGFHCASCFFSQFETLRDGAAVHMITDQYFDEMMEEINNLVNDRLTLDPQLVGNSQDSSGESQHN